VKKIKLTPRLVPYSSRAGGGLTLVNEEGGPSFVIAIVGTNKGVTRRESDEISKRLLDLIARHELHVSERTE
jgi:hypothetical protein